MNIIKAMETRKSVRSYLKDAIEESVLTHLECFLSTNRSPLAEGRVRYEIITNFSKQAKTGFLYGIGKINAPAMIVGIYEKTEDLVEIGFQLEQAVLYLTQKDYGTCFLGTYDETTLRSCCHLSDTEHIGIVLIFGKSNEKSRFMNGTFRNLAGSTKRKEYKEFILNLEEWTNQPEVVDILQHAILAPSGNNMQPVRVTLHETKATFYVIEEKYLIDLGIFLSHFYLCCLEKYDNVTVSRINQTQGAIDGMKPLVELSWGCTLIS